MEAGESLLRAHFRSLDLKAAFEKVGREMKMDQTHFSVFCFIFDSEQNFFLQNSLTFDDNGLIL